MQVPKHWKRQGLTRRKLSDVKSVALRGLLEVANISKKKGRRLRITEKGRLFLEHYRVCEDLFPPF
jgi:hypothetical protein